MDLDFEKPSVRFFVAGTPAPGGSKRFMGLGKKTGRAILVDMGGERNKNWRACVTAFAYEAFVYVKPFRECALELKCEFVMARPKAHFYSDKKRKGQLRPDAAHWHINAPDTTKLLRSTEDAMKGIAWDDDSRVALQIARKVYGEKTGCHIEITPL